MIFSLTEEELFGILFVSLLVIIAFKFLFKTRKQSSSSHKLFPLVSSQDAQSLKNNVPFISIGELCVCITTEGLCEWEHTDLISNLKQPKINELFNGYGTPLQLSGISGQYSILYNNAVFVIEINGKYKKLEYKKPLKVIQMGNMYKRTVLVCEEGIFSYILKEDCSIIKFPFKKDVNQLSCGCNHFLLSTNDGLYGYGLNTYGQLGSNINEECTEIRQISEFNNQFIDVFACGYEFSIVKTQDNEIYVAGMNNEGQLGLGHNRVISSKSFIKNELFQNNNFPNISNITCGRSHTIAITETGEVIGFGMNNVGQLGKKDRRNRLSPQFIEFFKDTTVIYANCGTYCTIFITSDKNLYFSGFTGRRINNLTNSFYLIPTLLPPLEYPIMTNEKKNHFARTKSARTSIYIN